MRFIQMILLLGLLPTGLALADDNGVELADYMSKLQYFGHKAGLAIDQQNHALTEFYLHELEEAIEALQEVDTYDGFAVGKLSTAMLTPPFKKLESA